jgi:hypothetical protein
MRASEILPGGLLIMAAIYAKQNSMRLVVRDWALHLERIT